LTKMALQYLIRCYPWTRKAFLLSAKVAPIV
jgi:hypothetical protein